ncbi:hypothetical protein [Plesiomonas sp. ZOR0011]|uniref:hypothetical protein n=1 Tax=Plesiomonas sp. ZOR0011 TaxID=1339230 RepID=UPI000646C405|nr:hypothetical protein [Plesiomonas sp. ZOR0011]
MENVQSKSSSSKQFLYQVIFLFLVYCALTFLGVPQNVTGLICIVGGFLLFFISNIVRQLKQEKLAAAQADEDD